mgnify:CR=1 FL=1
MRMRIIMIVLLMVFAGLGRALPSWAQDPDELQSLVDDSAEEEEELDNIPGASIPGLDNDIVSGKLRMPSGEEVERLRISQDRDINPEEYLVGPGDVLQLYIWGEFDLSYMLQVDPEGNVLIPTVGSFHVSEMTLADAKRLVYEAAQKKYPGVEITISLASMRLFTAYITGAVLGEGGFTIHPATRLSDFIERAGGFLDELRGSSIQEEVDGRKVTRVRRIQNRPASRRAIQITHRDGSKESVDYDMFLATGLLEYNPYILMGDRLHVGFMKESLYLFGAVNQEGKYEFREGDTIGDLITLAKGSRVDAPIQRVELWRFDPGTEISRKIVLGDNDVTGQEFVLDDISDTPLQSNDMVFVRARSLWQQMPTVLVYGEVEYRGRYRIFEGQTRVRDIVDGPAGGLTEKASLISSKVIRSRLRKQIDPELDRLRKLSAVTGLADLTVEDKSYLKTKAREDKARVAIDFERLYLDNDDSQNILLESGDVIFIPAIRRTISMSGQVEKPGLIDYEEGRTVGYYLELAGGFTYDAQKSGARLIRSRTGLREELEDDLIVEAGDEIWVPQKERINVWEFTQSTIRTFAEALTLLILVRSI